MAMSFKESAFFAYQTLRELAAHEVSLATSLQSLVPNKETSSKSAEYLHEDGQMLRETSEKVKDLMQGGSPGVQ